LQKKKKAKKKPLKVDLITNTEQPNQRFLQIFSQYLKIILKALTFTTFYLEIVGFINTKTTPI